MKVTLIEERIFCKIRFWILILGEIGQNFFRHNDVKYTAIKMSFSVNNLIFFFNIKINSLRTGMIIYFLHLLRDIYLSDDTACQLKCTLHLHSTRAFAMPFSVFVI